MIRTRREMTSKTNISDKAIKPQTKLLFISLFLILYSLKMTLFNFSIMNTASLGSFLFKFSFSLFITAIICPVFLRLKSPIPFILFYTAGEVYIFSNISYFSYFHSYLHLFQSAALFTEGVGQVAHFTIPVNYKHIVMLIDLPLFIYILRQYSVIRETVISFRTYQKLAAGGFLALVLCNEAWNYSHGNSFFKVIEDYSVGEPVIVERYGTIVNNVCDVILNYGGKNLASHIEYGELVSNSGSKADKPNIIVIQVESMDANILNKKYAGEYIMPNLQSLAEKNVYYPYVLSYHKAGGTSDSEFSVINSVEPLGNFPSIKISKYDYPNSMLKKLSAESYTTYAFHGNTGKYYNRNVAFTKMGFKEFEDIKRMGFKDVGWGAPDHEVYDYVLDKMKGAKAPFFSYIITLSSHTPFTSVGNYFKDNSFDEIEEDKTRNYYNSLAYVDKSIKDLVDRVKSDFENSYVFIFGDHTPDINTDEFREAAFLDENNYLEFVPLVIITPDNKNYRETRETASFLDFAPTIMEAAEIPYSMYSDGRKLLDFNSNGKKIPFNGKEYDREDLFERINGYK